MNLTFENFQYARPQFDLFSASFRKASAQFEAASSAEEQARALAQTVAVFRLGMDDEDEYMEAPPVRQRKPAAKPASKVSKFPVRGGAPARQERAGALPKVKRSAANSDVDEWEEF